MGDAVTTIQKSHPLPYYAQLAEILRDEIRSGQLTPGDLLPSESELGEAHGISRTAVRQALDLLVGEGLVHKEKGRGTFVASPKVNEFVVQEMRGFFEEMTRRGETVETQLLTADIRVVPPYAVAPLEVDSSDEVVFIERIRLVNDTPMVAVRTYLPAARFAALLDHDLVHASLYDVLRSEFAIRAGGGHRRFEAEAASADLARYLGLATGDPILKLTATNLDGDGRPFEHFIACYVADRTSFDVEVGAEGGPATAKVNVLAGRA